MRLNSFNQNITKDGASIFGQSKHAGRAPIKDGYRRPQTNNAQYQRVDAEILDIEVIEAKAKVVYEKVTGEWKPNKKFQQPGAANLNAKSKTNFQKEIGAKPVDAKQAEIAALSQRMDRLEQMVMDNRDAMNPSKSMPFLHAKQPRMNENFSSNSKLGTADIISRRYAMARNQVSFA